MSGLSPEAVEVQARPDLEFPELARPVKAEGMQYAGLTPVERALAEDDLHMSTCDEPSIDGCGDCQRKLARFRHLLEVATPVIETQARDDERQKVLLDVEDQFALARVAAYRRGYAQGRDGEAAAAPIPVAAASNPTDTRPEETQQ